jgi:hypothetical protein
VAQTRVTHAQHQSACSQTMSWSKYLISIGRITTTSTTPQHGNGTYWCMYVNGGDKSYSRHHTVSSSKFSAHAELLSGRISASGQPFLSFLIYYFPLATFRLTTKTMSLLHSSTPIVWVLSGSWECPRTWERWPLRCKNSFRC